jgi:hypothetical protein
VPFVFSEVATTSPRGEVGRGGTDLAPLVRAGRGQWGVTWGRGRGEVGRGQLLTSLEPVFVCERRVFARGLGRRISRPPASHAREPRANPRARGMLDEPNHQLGGQGKGPANRRLLAGWYPLGIPARGCGSHGAMRVRGVPGARRTHPLGENSERGEIGGSLRRPQLLTGNAVPAHGHVSGRLYDVGAVGIRGSTNDKPVKGMASSRQLWRLNTLGCLEIRREPGEAIGRNLAKDLLHDLAEKGLWQPEVRAGKS